MNYYRYINSQEGLQQDVVYLGLTSDQVALVYEPNCGRREGVWGSCGVSANEYSCTQE